MGAVYDEFERELAKVKRTYANNPRRELIRLFLLALEREELVSIGYRESLMKQRIAAMPLPDSVKELLRHSLIWIWKDEEMHTIYIRGAILKLGGWFLRSQAIMTQIAGGVGGWAGSVMQHSRWRRAPLSRTLATMVSVIGGLVGKVPPDVKRHLQFGPFRNFCVFNIDAEQTAAVCWNRIAELASSQPDLEPQLARDFKRIAEDEVRHCKVFEILADALTADDTLADMHTIESLIEQIRKVGEEFLSRKHRRNSVLENPIGSGQSVRVLRAARHDEKRSLFRKLLDECGMRDLIGQRALFLNQSIEQMKIAIKPTFMLGYDRKDLSPITDRELIDDLAAYLCEMGCKDIAIVEGRNIYDRFFRNRTGRDIKRTE